MQKTLSLHFILEGKYFTKQIQRFVFEHRMSMFHRFLDELRPLPNNEQRTALANGDGQFVGYTLCDNYNCDQCKQLRKYGKFRYVAKEDKQYKVKLIEHKEFVKKHFFEIDGDTNIAKAIVSKLIIAKVTLDETKQVRYKGSEGERLSNRKLAKDYLQALDDWEFAQDSLFREFGVLRDQDYPVGSREWKAQVEANSILDVIMAKAIYDDEIKELVRQCTNSGVTTAMASEKMFAVTSRQMEDESIMEKFAKKIEIRKPSKPKKETVKIGGFHVPKNLVDDYANAINMSNTSAMVYKAKYGKLDPTVEMRKFTNRIEMHKAIFESIGLPYHQDIERIKRKLTKKEEQSLEFQNALSDYIDKLN